MPYLRKRTYPRRRYPVKRIPYKPKRTTFKPNSFAALYKRGYGHTVVKRRPLFRKRYVQPKIIRQLQLPPRYVPPKGRNYKVPVRRPFTRQPNIPTVPRLQRKLPSRIIPSGGRTNLEPLAVTPIEANPLLGFADPSTYPNPFIGPIRPVTVDEAKRAARRTPFKIPPRLYAPSIQRARVRLQRRLPLEQRKLAGKRQDGTDPIFEIEGQPLVRKTKRLKATPPQQTPRKMRGRTHLIRYKAARDTILESMHPSNGPSSRPASPMILFDDPPLDVIKEG